MGNYNSNPVEKHQERKLNNNGFPTMTQNDMKHVSERLISKYRNGVVSSSLNLSSQISETSLGLSQMSMKGGDLDLEYKPRQRYLNVNTSLLKMGGGGCGCNNGEEPLEHNSTSSVQNINNFSNSDFMAGGKKIMKKTIEDDMSSNSNTTKNASATSSAFMVGGKLEIPRGILSSTSHNSSVFMAGGKFEIPKGGLSSTTDVRLDLLGGKKKEKETSEKETTEDEEEEDEEDSDSDNEDDEEEEDDEDEDSNEETTDKKTTVSGGSSEVLIDKKYMFSDSGTYYGSDSSNDKYRKFRVRN